MSIQMSLQQIKKIQILISQSIGDEIVHHERNKKE